jgi:DNA-binding SARP family transcriptional activator/pimeloyl-ACP methyl ester carboxylesterase
VRISLLGPLQVDGTPGNVVLGAAKERSLLAALALRPGCVVSTDALVRALWGDQPPASARKTLQTYVSNLRQALGADSIQTDPTGYVLHVAPDDVDVVRFRASVRAGEDALRDGDATTARNELRGALALWRGDPFAGVAAHTGLANEAVCLREERLSALETRISADLADGAHSALVAELEGLVRDHPYRERLWGDLMVALYRCGRQADALATYQRARTILVDELGLDPGGELRRIEEAILNHDASMAAPSDPGTDVARTIGTTNGILRSPVRYAKSSGDVSIAYQIAGDGPVDILAIPGFVSHLDIWWNAPTDGLVRRLTDIGRLIAFDKRGMGLSDRPEVLAPEDWLDDSLAVLDATGAKDVVVLGVSAGTPTAIRLAALHPDRVRALVVFGGGPRSMVGPGYEVGLDRALVESFAADLEAGWGSGVAIDFYAPSRARDPHVREYWARYQQLSAAPAAAMRAFWTAVDDDVVGLLPSIDVPTLVLHPERDVIAPIAWARFMAERIPGAALVPLDSDVDLICASDVIDEMAEEIAVFLGQKLPTVAKAPVESKLVTVLAVSCDAPLRYEVGRSLVQLGGTLQSPHVPAMFDGPGTALRAAAALCRARSAGHADGPFGIGVHVGECTSSGSGMRGDAVDVAHRLALAAAPGTEVLVTTIVQQLVATSELDLEPRPEQDAFALVDQRPARARRSSS